MNPNVNAIANRLSLRQPQRDSLEILARVCDVISLEKDADPAKALEVVKGEFPTVTDFERDFPSLCFALATGVGKTRLMGAFISYLYKAENIRHFFVLAPNLTIYNKLVADFTPNTPKYVFQGIADFATNAPEIITGDNYESGRGVRKGAMFETDELHVNIFNISKINSEVRGDKAPRIERLVEYIGESYFEYLSKLDDLVLLMDESHRYRASAGVRAINELKPILGLELTATPQIEKGNAPEPFKNVMYSYPLSIAMNDGFVKEPAVATRENFDAQNYDKDGIEKLKLEDGVRIHENTKVELEVYARETQQKIVKPFMLVVATDTEHANAILKTIESDAFFEGRYKAKVITVHSNQRGEEKDETVAQLLTVEDKDNPTEIVIHVNMLKEGWDVTNLYTIVPLRAANSKTLVEQSIGRGLRLPYGKRTGVAAVDRLTIVSHDKFQETIDEANKPDSIIRTGVIIGKDIPLEKTQVVVVESRIENKISGYVDAMVLRDRDADAANSSLEERLYAMHDANFNVTGLVNTGGTVVERYIYDPYGAPTVIDDDWTSDANGISDVNWLILYQGKRYDNDVGLYHFLNRDVDPALGRPMSADPIGYPDGASRYQWEMSNPVGRLDPLGLWAVDLEVSYESTKRELKRLGVGKGAEGMILWGVTDGRGRGGGG